MKRDPLLAFGIIAALMALGAAAIPPDHTNSEFGFLFAINKPECEAGNSCRSQFETRLWGFLHDVSASAKGTRR